jgi:hypothetical protein
MILGRWTLTLHAPEVHDVADQWERTEARVLADFPARLEAVEEDLGDLLPAGYEISFEPAKD